MVSNKGAIVLALAFLFFLGGIFVAAMLWGEEAQPPTWQEGDDDVVTTTVGHMRVALWYYEAYDVEKTYAKSLEAVIDADHVNDEALIEQNEDLKAELTKERGKRLTAQNDVVTGVVVTGGIGLVLTLAAFILGGAHAH